MRVKVSGIFEYTYIGSAGDNDIITVPVHTDFRHVHIMDFASLHSWSDCIAVSKAAFSGTFRLCTA